MLRRLVFKALLHRKRQLAVAAAAVLIAATLVAALTTLSLGMKSQAGRELEAYGANIILVPAAVALPAGMGRLALGEIAEERYISGPTLAQLETYPPDEVRGYIPYLYALASYQGQKVVVTGTLFDRLAEFAASWQIEGQWVNHDGDTGSSIIGQKVARQFDLRPGDSFSLDFGDRTLGLQVAGVASVGGSEDSQIFIDLSTVQGLSGRPGQIDMVQIRASAEQMPLKEIASSLENNLTGVEARVVGQIAGAEESVLAKLELLMALITAVVLIGSGVAVFSTLTASVLERRREIGLMKALGARRSWMALVFLAEAWSLGLAGGLLGGLLGLGMAQAYKVVNQHGGRLVVHSKKHEGTRVELFLPRFYG